MRRLKIISIVMLLSIVALLPKSNAALVSKPGTSPLVNTTVSNSYLLCHKMKGLGESLYGAGSNVQPHLATNKDWGAVSYLSNSIYGTNTKGGNTGLKVTIDGKEYYSTNGNKSGVMNWGINPDKTVFTQTASLIEDYMELVNKDNSLGNSNVFELEKAAKSGSKYVEVINTGVRSFLEPTTGMAMSEINKYSFVDWKSVFNYTNYPIAARKGLFGYTIGLYECYGIINGVQNWKNYNGTNGSALEVSTFRPVVWN